MPYTLLEEVINKNMGLFNSYFDPEHDEIIADRGFRSCEVPFKLYVPHSLGKGEKQLPVNKCNEFVIDFFGSIPIYYS